MAHTVAIKQIREVNNSKKIVANADVIIDSIIVVRNFKILRNDHNGFWVSNPQTEGKEKFYDMVEILDWELEQAVRNEILSAYLKMLQKRNVIPEVNE